MHLVWSNKAVDIQDVGALILISPLYYIVLFLIFLYSKIMFHHSSRRDAWSISGACYTSAKWKCQNLAIWSVARHQALRRCRSRSIACRACGLFRYKYRLDPLIDR